MRIASRLGPTVKQLGWAAPPPHPPHCNRMNIHMRMRNVVTTKWSKEKEGQSETKEWGKGEGGRSLPPTPLPVNDGDGRPGGQKRKRDKVKQKNWGKEMGGRSLPPTPLPMNDGDAQGTVVVVVVSRSHAHSHHRRHTDTGNT